MITKTEIANISKIELCLKNLICKKTIQKFVIVDKFCNCYFLIFGIICKFSRRNFILASLTNFDNASKFTKRYIILSPLANKK